MLPAIALFAVLGVVLPAFLALELPSFEFSYPSVVLYILVLYTAARLADLVSSGERRLLSLTFWLFVYVWGVLSALLQTGADIFPWKRAHSDNEQLETAALLALAVFAYDAGSVLARRREQRHPTRRAVVFSLRWTLALGIVTTITTTLMIVALGGLSSVVTSRGDASAELIEQSGGEVAIRNLMEALLRSTPYVAFVALLFALLKRWGELGSRDRVLLAAMFAVVLPFFFVANYPNALPRGWLGAVALSLGFVAVPWRRWTMPVVVAGLVTAFVFVFPYSDQNRLRSTDQRVELAQREYGTAAWPLVSKGDYDVFVQFINGVIYVNEQGVMYGNNLLGAALFWVPRRLWEDKPLNSGHVLGYYMHNGTVNLSAPLWLEGYLAFGTFGVASLMGLYGFIMGALEARYVRQVQLGVHWGALQLFVPFWAGYQVFFLRGPLMNSVAYSSFAILLMLLLARWRLVDLVQPPAIVRATRTHEIRAGSIKAPG